MLKSKEMIESLKGAKQNMIAVLQAVERNESGLKECVGIMQNMLTYLPDNLYTYRQAQDGKTSRTVKDLYQEEIARVIAKYEVVI